MLRALAGGSLFGETWGPAPPQVLALHGWGRTHDDFRGAFGDGASAGGDGTLPGVLAPDLPGFGATPAPDEPWGTDRYAELVSRLFEAGEPELAVPAVVVGHSFGGRVAVQLAATRPELVRALVLTGVPLLPRTGGKRRPPAAYRAVRLLRRMRLVGEARLERARQRHGSADYRNAQGVMRDVLVRVVNERYEDALSRVDCPVELVWAEDDTEAPLAVAEALVERLPGAELTRCPGAGHLLPSTAPEALRRGVARALERA